MFESLNDELITIEAMAGNLKDMRRLLPEEFCDPFEIVKTTPVIGHVYGPILVKFDRETLFHVYYSKSFNGMFFVFRIIVVRDKVITTDKREIWLDWPAGEINAVLWDTVSEMTISLFAKMGIMVSFHFPVNWY